MPRPDGLSVDFILRCHSWLAALCAECLCLRAVLLVDGESLVRCCSWLMPDITLKPPSPRSASQVFPDHRCTPHLPSSSSHNSVILARTTFFTNVFRCLTLSRLSAIKRRGKVGVKEGRKGERMRGKREEKWRNGGKRRECLK